MNFVVHLEMKCSIVAQSYVYDWIPSACFVFSYAVTRAISISNTDNIDGSPHVVSKHSKPDFSLPMPTSFLVHAENRHHYVFLKAVPPQGANSYGRTSWSKKMVYVSICISPRSTNFTKKKKGEVLFSV